ncbi:GPI biosynthesis protein family Pig-F-domain-containing protein [Xylaria bambusicola]|uniref:GPI biosynthesis protein family Pig-F-domain-containing protein n=1 Tax=Xylaria bambusicola TaxID=326684 RepID=UPI00200796D5|nr:GPI biosynthesis protein family Pig-F-domain-containing protein [Xylaria bambusicola]KAI0528234.1 GPI biosynthesis protein family Pig-F-domain-containing protein [Xylaria bambusicola]
MSEALRKAVANAQEPAKTSETESPTRSQPIQTLPSDHTLPPRHVHMAMPIASLVYRFRGLVTDPVRTMSTMLQEIIMLQIIYTIFGLPAAGAKEHKKPRPGEKKKAGAEDDGPNVAVTSLVSFVLTIVSAGVLHVLLVLFGAPFLTHFPHTFLCAFHISLLGLYPLFYTRGVSSKDWMEILSARAPIDEVYGGLLGAGVGAWLGAVPIPLDWDREWQKWPVTIICGVYIGYTIGVVVGGTWAFGKRLGNSESS